MSESRPWNGIYEEYEDGTKTVVKIAARENERAWIQSDVTYSIEP